MGGAIQGQAEAFGFSPRGARCTPLQSTPLLCTSVLGRPPLASLQNCGFIFQNGSQRPRPF